MEVKEAVKAAKSYIADVFSEEYISEIGLEEVEFDNSKKEWKITIGFRRPWTRKQEYKGPMTAFQSHEFQDRWYKLVRVRDSDGKIIAVKDRELKAA